MREAGSYGYFIKIPTNTETSREIISKGELKVGLESTNGGGLAIYGKNFGRYHMDPSMLIKPLSTQQKK